MSQKWWHDSLMWLEFKKCNWIKGFCQQQKTFPRILGPIGCCTSFSADTDSNSVVWPMISSANLEGSFLKKIVDGWNPASTRWGKGSLSQVHAQEWVGRTKEKNHWNHHPDYTVIFRLLGFWTARHLAGNYTEITSSLAPTGSPNITGLANQYFTNLDFFFEICRDTLPVWGSVKISSTI